MASMQSSKTTINAIHENDLEPFLEKLGLLEQIKNREKKCDVCGDIITCKTIGAIYLENNIVKLACNKPYCYHEALKRDMN